MRFRNVEVDERAPVETWPSEAIQAALERGSLVAWRRLAAAIQADPWGPVARAVEEVLGYSRPYGVADAMERVVADARALARVAEREAVASELGGLLRASGLRREEFASRLGTSASRLSTYLSGKVLPSAALLVRARRVASPTPRGRTARGS